MSDIAGNTAFTNRRDLDQQAFGSRLDWPGLERNKLSKGGGTPEGAGPAEIGGTNRSPKLSVGIGKVNLGHEHCS